jgi:hypothetical protein
MPDINELFENYNHEPHPDLDGLSPTHMNLLLYHTFEPESPLVFPERDAAVYDQVPLLKQVRYLLGIVNEQNELRLTKTGSLPVKVVKDMYNQGFIKDELIEAGFYTVARENKCPSIELTRILCEISGLTKKRNGKLSLTKRAEKMMDKPAALFRQLFQTFAGKFNWAYFDGYGQHPLGQFGVGYSLYLTSKYGAKMRPAEFYAEKYFKALPDMAGYVEGSFYTSQEEVAFRCYSTRTFRRFMDYVGIIRIKKETNEITGKISLCKTPLYDQVIEFRV